MSLNTISIQGRMAQTPELHMTKSQVPVTSFTVAVERDYQKPGEERQVDWIRCVAWRTLAEFVCKHFTKGSPIVAHGRLECRNYTDKEGNKRDSWEITADNVYFGGPKSQNAGSPAQTAPPAETADDVTHLDYLPDTEGAELPF